MIGFVAYNSVLLIKQLKANYKFSKKKTRTLRTLNVKFTFIK